MHSVPFDLETIRSQFPSLARREGGKAVIYFDGPAGTQVPHSVVKRVSECMLQHNANRSGRFPTSREVDAIMSESHATLASFLGAEDPESIAFGPNMTTLTMHFSRSIAREWRPGDHILISSLDHDANFTPWVLAARDAGIEVKQIGVNLSDATLDMNSLASLLSDRTRLVAVTAASNAVGSLTPIQEIAKLVHAVGAELFVDAVHFAPHRLVSIQRWDCDFLVCSAYKFFGPHIGVLYGRRDRMAMMDCYKLRPAPDTLPGRWMTGTQNHACIAGAAAAVEYMASLSPLTANDHTLRERIVDAMAKIERYETELIARLIKGLQSIEGVRVFGITDPNKMVARAPTVSFQIAGHKAVDVSERLGIEGIFSWHGNYYALPLSQALGVEPDGMVRLGCMHYNTRAEVDRSIEVIEDIARNLRGNHIANN